MASKLVIRLFMTLLSPEVKDSDEDHAEQCNNDQENGDEDPHVVGDCIIALRPNSRLCNITRIRIDRVAGQLNEVSQRLSHNEVNRVDQEHDKGEQVGVVKSIAAVEVLVLNERDNKQA